MRQLVFVHGRAQEHKDVTALKAEWLEALYDGLARAGLTLPISTTEVRFPFYGDSLFDMAEGASADEAAEIIVRGDIDADERRFTQAFLEEVREKAGITDDQLADIAGQEVIHQGPLNWKWSLATLRAIDRFVPYATSSSIALFTHDVYQYLKNPQIRETIDTGVSAAIKAEEDTVVVAHSLGTIVAYNLLRQQGHLRKWKVPLFITLGSPLAVNEIRKVLRALAPIRRPPCVEKWFNGLDERDVVALYPLDTARFPLNPVHPAIENKTDVRNKTRNRHGIAGYLDNDEIARRIYNALLGNV